MAYVNVRDWSADQVTDWLKGLDNVILQYTTSFLNNLVTGHQLLNLRADDLEHLGVRTVGHQEIILEAVEHLRSFHFELDKENLQMLALRLSCAANSLYKELLLVDDDCTVVLTQTMSDVHNIITSIKPLVCWLDRSPFAGDKDYIDNKTQLLDLGFEMATSAHRDIFSEQPARTIRKNCEELARMADHIIQEISDPMILQPASLDLATLKKKEQELGFFILPNNHAIHQIAEIKYGSPAHGSSKIEEGDEIVQVNYQTVVGWQRKKVMILLQESPPDIVLTLKKRPRHTKVYGQIYMKPYRLPSRRSDGLLSSRWNDNIPSPALLLDSLPSITIPGIISPVLELPESEIESEEIELVDIEEPLDSPLDGDVRIYPIKPRPILQRRNSFTCSIQFSKIPYPKLEECVQLLKKQADLTQSSPYHHSDNAKFEQDSKVLRDKSASCMLDVELNSRPTTVIGLTQNKLIEQRVCPSFNRNNDNINTKTLKRVNFDDKNNELMIFDSIDNKRKFEANNSNLNDEKSVSVSSLVSLTNEDISFIDEGRELTDRTSMTIIDGHTIDDIDDDTNMMASNNINNKIQDSSLADVHIHDIIKKFDGSDNKEQIILAKPKVFPRSQLSKKPPTGVSPVQKSPDIISAAANKRPLVPPRNLVTVKSVVRGRLDKSHSTPAYDLTDEEQHSPIEIFLGEKSPINNSNSKLLLLVEPSTSSSSSSPSDFFTQPIVDHKYEELGIPVVVDETTINDNNNILDNVINNNVLLGQSNSIITTTEEQSLSNNNNNNNNDDLPPKPPPRTFGIVDVGNKPAYPSDSPKPVSLLELTRLATPQKVGDYSPVITTTTKPIFEFPDSIVDLKKQQCDNNSSVPKFYCNDLNVAVTGTAATTTATKSISKFFEPKLASTPIIKSSKMDFNDSDTNNYKMATLGFVDLSKTSAGTTTTSQSSTIIINNTPTTSTSNINSDNKVSPTNSIVRVMNYSNKNKAVKKKNTLIAKRRKVTVNDLSPADIQGFLYQRLRSKHNQNVHWEKRWFVLLGNCLYGFKSKDDPKAACLIFLSGFTVALASEVNSRSNAFKVYHTGTVFYFSAEDAETLQSWIELISSATLNNDQITKNIDNNNYYSGTDESDNEKPKSITQNEKNEKSSSDSLRKFGSLKKFTSSKKHNNNNNNNSDTSQQNGSTSLDRKWFFNKSSGHSKHSIPVPTKQFRSYRKIRTNDEPTLPTVTNSVTTGNFTSHVAFFAPRSEIQTLAQLQQNVSVPNLTDGSLMKHSTVADKKLLAKSKPLNYVHASNPSLCNISEFNVSNFNKKSLTGGNSNNSSNNNNNNKQGNDNLAGFVTLEELMIRQAEERKLNPHNFDQDDVPMINLNLIKPDVVYGEIPTRSSETIAKLETTSSQTSKTSRGHSRNASDSQKILLDKHEPTTSSCFGKRLGSIKKLHLHSSHSNNNIKTNEGFDGSKISTYPKVAKGFDQNLNRSLPRTHKLQDNLTEQQPSLLRTHYASDRNLISSSSSSTVSSSFKDRSYEMIYCPEITTDVQFAQNRHLDDRMYAMDTPKKSSIKIKKQRSFSSNDKKSTVTTKNNDNKLIDLAKYSNKVSDSCSSNNNNKIKLKSAVQYTPMSLPLNQDQKSKPKLAFELNLDDKSSKGGKLKQMFSSSKQNDAKKEKTFLGSPKLHRAIFRKQNSTGSEVSSRPSSSTQSMSHSTYSLETSTSPSNTEQYSVSISPHIDYPGLEYPPVFEPETYSLADPQCSLTILRKQGKNE